MKRIFTFLMLMLVWAGSSWAQNLQLSVSNIPEKRSENTNHNSTPPAPLNILQGGDNIATATVISSLPYSDNGTTDGYTNDYNVDCPYTGSTAPDVVYSYSPATNQTLDIDLCGSTYDTKLFVYQNNTSTVVGCNDDYYYDVTCGYYVSAIFGLGVTAGNTYYIVVDGYSGYDYGDYTISVEAAAVYPIPPNDECTGAVAVTGPFPQTVTGTTLGATIDCSGVLDWNAVWYAITLPYASNDLTVDWCGTANMSTVGVVYYATCPVSCGDYVLYNTNVWQVCGTPVGATTALTSFNAIPGPAIIYYPAYSIPQMDHTITFNVVELTCPYPTNPYADVVGTTTANLTWTPGGTETDWEYVYGLYPLAIPTGSGTPTNSSTVNPISGLLPGQIYQFYTRAYCGTDYSDWVLSPTFTTLCEPISSFPWTEGFEGVTIPSFPSCWYKENGDWVTTNNGNSTYDADARSGTQFLRDSWSATNEYMWTPSFALNAGTSYDFSFWWAGDGYADWTGDVFCNTLQNSSGAIQLGTSFVVSTTVTTFTYTQALYTFVPTVSGAYYFGIRVNEPTGIPWYLSFDDFKMEPTAACPYPMTLAADNIGSTSANLTWAPGGSETNWEYVYGLAPLPSPSGSGTATTSNTVNPISPLIPSTAYQFYVRANCGDNGYSTWAGPASFSTSQIPATLPLNEGWESGASDNWTFVNGSETNKWYVGTATAHTGSYSAYISSDGGVTNSYINTATSVVHIYRDILFTGGTVGYTLTFWSNVVGESCCDFLSVYLVDPSITPVAGTELSSGLLASYNIQTGWTQETIALPGSLTGGTHRLVFTWNNDGSVGVPPVALDDISIVAISCPAPTINTPTASYTTADVSWVAGGSELQWKYFYCESGCGGPSGDGTLIGTNSVHLTGLTEATNYQFWVKAFCDPDNSTWAGPVPFTTLQSCPAPSNLSATGRTQTSAQLGWVSNASGSTWDVELGPVGFTVDNDEELQSWSETPDNPVLANGLSGSSSYDFYVREICDYQSPKIDHFYMAMNGDFVLDPNLSGGYSHTADAGETMLWERYDQSNPFWYNIWFYNDPVDLNRMKKISMGFWIQKLDPDLPSASYDYVVNWSTPDWYPLVPGYPTPMDEQYIQRSPSQGQIDLGADPVWVELNYTIPDYNPEWISVDIWGQNIIILDEVSEPPMNSRLHYWWTQDPGRGGIIVHECLPKPHGDVSPWSGPYSFMTACNPIVAPYTETFTTWPPVCWDLTGGTYSWSSYFDGVNQSAYANYWGQTLGNTDIMTTGVIDVSSLTNPVLSFDWSHYYMSSYPHDSLVVLVSDDNGLTWTMVWNKAGADFASNDGAGTTYPGTFTSSGDIYLSTFGDLLLIRFYGYSGFGPNPFVDNVKVEAACLTDTWTGAVSNDWSDKNNWSCGKVPNLTMSIIIPSGLTNYPVIGSGVTAECFDMSLGTGATFVVATGGTLNIVNP